MNNSAPVSILLVDDHALIRESWKLLLENNPRFKVIAECGNGPSAVAFTRELVPDIILLDVNMNPPDGLNLTQKLLHAAPGSRIIGLSVNNSPRVALRMVELGAKGYLTKTSSLEEISYGILQVYYGKEYICDEIRNNTAQGEPRPD